VITHRVTIEAALGFTDRATLALREANLPRSATALKVISARATTSGVHNTNRLAFLYLTALLGGRGGLKEVGEAVILLLLALALVLYGALARGLLRAVDAAEVLVRFEAVRVGDRLERLRLAVQLAFLLAGRLIQGTFALTTTT